MDVVFRRLTPLQLGIDLSIAAFALVVRVLYMVGDVHGPSIVVTVVLMAAAFALQRLSPALALGLAWLGAVVQMVGGHNPDIANAAIFFVLFATARHGSRRLKWIGLGSAIGGGLVAAAYLSLGSLFGGLAITGIRDVPQIVLTFVVIAIPAVTVLAMSWVLGLLVKTWLDARTSRVQRAVAEQNMIVEQERTRIARDMHDVVAHSLAVVIAQADGARYAAAADPVAATEALGTISSTAREALIDVRLLLAQLRHRQEEGPQPVLDDLDRVYDQMAAAGLVVEPVVVGERPALPAGTQIALYRIVQESLTNALRHGDASRPVAVETRWSPTDVTLRITSARTGDELAREGGHGIAGMRERATLVGGRLEAGPVDGSYLVEARIPLTQEVR